MATKLNIVSPAQVERSIYLVRGHKVILDRDLAALYGVETRVLNQAVRRNVNRFPEDFMLRLSREEIRNISQFVISSGFKKSPSVFAFTEQGVAMLSSVLRSPRAVAVNVEIMRAFVRLREMLASNAELADRLRALEKKYDKRFKVVFQAIRQLMEERSQLQIAKREIGFHAIPPSATKGKLKSKLTV
jgi:hypothetical protein